MSCYTLMYENYLRIEQDKAIQHLPVVEKLLHETYRFLACQSHRRGTHTASFITHPRIGKT